MLRSTLHAAALTVLGTATLTLAQAPPPPPAPPVPATGTTAQPGTTAGTGQTYRVKQVLGTKVSIDGNVSIGTVEDLVFDDQGYVEYLIVQNEGRLVTVPWQATKFNFQQQTAVVNITQEKFRTLPTYTVQEYPNFSTPAYRTEIYRVYGLTPGQTRRMERREERREERRPPR